MTKVEYQYFLLWDRWLARLKKDLDDLYPKEFWKNGIWQHDKELNLALNDSIMDYGDSSVFEYKKISEEDALKFMELETYKQRVRECLIEIQNCTEEYADKLMREYEDDFEEALNQFCFTPETMACGMVMRYY